LARITQGFPLKKDKAMKSANLSLFTVIGVACALVVSGSIGCGVSGDGLGNATDPESNNVGSGASNSGEMNAGTGNAPGQGGESQPAAGGNTATGGNTMMGSKGGSASNTGGATSMGSGGMRMGGSSGMNTGGNVGMGGAVGMGGMNMGGALSMGGMNMGGALSMGGTGGMITGGIGGMLVGGSSGMGGLVLNALPTPGEIKCGLDVCNDGDYCCITNGQAKCQGRSKSCQGGSYRSCDDQRDCAIGLVCCGSMLQNSFNTACVTAFQCTPPEVVVCANATQCGDGRSCCAKTASNMTIGVCQRSCQ
jgi:hypothetical protein